MTGQDGILNAVYKGKLYWFYGDTGRLSYALGNFAMAGATTDLPEKLDPDAGIDLKYFVGQDGFAKRMAPMEGEGVVWLFGAGRPARRVGPRADARLLPPAAGPGRRAGGGLRRLQRRQGPVREAQGRPGRAGPLPHRLPVPRPGRDGAEYVYFTAPYPALRVRADWKSYLDLASYEGYTCLKPGTRYGDKDRAQLDRDADGKLVWAWKRDTPPLSPKEQQELIAAGKMTREESPFRLQDADGGKPILLNNSSCFWNDYRKKYVLIASEILGATVLGEVWYSEADRPEGPWVHARRSSRTRTSRATPTTSTTRRSTRSSTARAGG